MADAITWSLKMSPHSPKDLLDVKMVAAYRQTSTFNDERNRICIKKGF